MDYQSELPDNELSEFVACFWELTNDDSEKRVVQILPDGYFDIIFTYIRNRPAKIVLIGLGTKPQRYTIPPSSRAYAVSLKLTSAEYLLKKPINTLLDGHMCLDNTIMALSGIVSGALVKGERIKPGNHGPLIYINASPSVKKVVNKVEMAGGKVIQPPVKIPAGHIAVIIDSEGNKIGIHSANL